MDLLTIDDLAPFAAIADDIAEQMVADAVALATLSAPCLAAQDLTPLQVAQAKAVLRSAVLRWHETGSGAVSQQTVGPFGQSFDTRQTRRTMFWPSEISALQNICKTGREGGAFSVDTASDAMQMHAVLGYGSQGGVYGFDIPPTDG